MIDTHSQLVPLASAGNASGRPVLRPVAQVDTAAAESGKIPQPGAGRQASAQAEIVAAVNQLNKQLHEVHSNLQFSIHEASGRVIVRVIDSETDETIRQMPSEAMLALAENARNLHGGKILDEQV